MEEEQNTIEMAVLAKDEHFYDTPQIETEKTLIAKTNDELEDYSSLCKYCMEKDYCKQTDSIETNNSSESAETFTNSQSSESYQAECCDPINPLRCNHCILLKRLPDFNLNTNAKMECCDLGSLIV